MIDYDKLKKMKACFALLPEPGEEVATELYNIIMELKVNQEEALAELGLGPQTTVQARLHERILELEEKLEAAEAELALFRETVGIRADAKACAADIDHWCNLMDKADHFDRWRANAAKLAEALEFYSYPKLPLEAGDSGEAARAALAAYKEGK